MALVEPQVLVVLVHLQQGKEEAVVLVVEVFLLTELDIKVQLVKVIQEEQTLLQLLIMQVLVVQEEQEVLEEVLQVIHIMVVQEEGQ